MARGFMTWNLSLRAQTLANELDSPRTANQEFAPVLLSAELSAQPEMDRLLVFPHSAFVRNRGHHDGYADHDD